MIILLMEQIYLNYAKEKIILSVIILVSDKTSFRTIVMGVKIIKMKEKDKAQC